MSRETRTAELGHYKNNTIDKGKTILWAGFSVIITAALLSFYFFYLMFFPFNVIDVKNSKDLPVVKKALTIDDQIAFTFDYCKHVDSQPRVVKEIISKDNVVTVSPVGTDLPQIEKGCGKVTIFHEIPDYTPEGKYRLYIFSSYPVNKFRNVDYIFRTEEFEVIPGGKGNGDESVTPTRTAPEAFFERGTIIPMVESDPDRTTSTNTAPTNNTTINNNNQPTPTAQPQPTPGPSPLINLPSTIKDILKGVI